MNILKNILQSILVTLVFAVICCGFYPVLIWGVSQLVFSHQANGGLISDASGTVLGSDLLGQNFNGDTYFNPRPSAAGSIGYDPTSSGGTNLGPTSQKLIDSIKAAVAAYRKMNNLSDSQLVPEDAVTSSASGLDPHISLENARLQLSRVAAKRGMAVADVQKLVDRYTDGRSLGIFGEPGVNVVMLNLALDGKIK
jgi:K+-transporting ATPase ATPase C chain